jgi:hypothetical protein
MPEPTSTALAVTAAGASTLAVIATAIGVPAPVVLAGVLGATIAVGQSGKLDWNWRSLAAALLAFAASLGLGIWGGSLASRVAVGVLNGMFASLHLPDGFADPLFTLLVSMLGQSQLLPIGLTLLRSKIGGAQ